MLILNTIIFQSCKEKCTKVYTPIIPLKVTIPSDTIKVGDSLFVECNLSSVLKDKENGNNIDFGKFRFHLLASAYQYSDTSKSLINQSKASTSFDVFDIVGKHVGASDLCFMDYLERTDSIKFKYLMVAKDTGLFGLVIYHFDNRSAHADNNVKITNTNCKEYIDYAAVIFNEGKTNRNLVSLFDTSYFDKRQLWELNHSIFFFYVKP